MQLTEAEQETVAGKARTLQERLDQPTDTGEPIEDPDVWIDEWQERVADGDPQRFRQRLARAGVSRTECRTRLRRHGWPSNNSLPAWVHRLNDLLQFVTQHGAATVTQDTADERPFEHLLAPIVAYATTRCDRAFVSERLSEKAWADLQNVLQKRLETFCAHPLFIEFKTFVAQRDPSLVFDDMPPPPEQPRRYYTMFIDAMSNGTLKQFFLEYAFLARLIGTLIDQWCDVVDEFSSRLESDYERLDATFGDGSPLGPVTAIKPRGEPHHRGQHVYQLTFESGTTVAYKPRPMDVEVAFNDVLTWINTTSNLPHLRTPTYLSYGEYGWMEWIDAEPCPTETAVHQYYRRAGMLVGLLYALEFSDGNLENIIAATDQPVPIDLETLIQPRAATDKLPVIGDVRHVVLDSVLRTGVVPVYWPTADVRDASGFGSQQATSIEAEVRDFQQINTDLMELDYRREAQIEGDNLPTLDGAVVTATEHIDDITDGFDAMYQFLHRQIDTLLQADGPLARFQETDVRVLYRSTSTYAKILTLMTTPAYLRTGLAFGCKVEALAKPLIANTDTDIGWAVYESERDALRHCDFPRFSARTDTTTLHGEERTVEGFFEETAYQRVQQRVTSLTDTDQREQRRYLEWGYGGADYVRPRSEPSKPIDGKLNTSVLEAQSRHQARAIFDRLRTTAQDNGQTWIHRKCRREGEVYIHATTPALYAGRMGIALFGAALTTVFDETTYRAFVEDVTAPLIERETDELAEYGIGGGAGLGSIIYGLTKLGQVLETETYINAAQAVAAQLTPARIDADEQYDVIDGSAGAILGLLALYEVTEDTQVLQRAVTAGNHLLTNSTTINGTPVWQSPTVGRALTGFGHGTAGIAYALLRLSDITDAERFRRVALTSLDYEDQHYDPDEQNWRDLRPETEGDFMDAWCHGRSGIGLARLGMADIEATAAIRRDIDRALTGIDASVLQHTDHICCGNGARIVFLQQAARTLDEPMYREHADHLLAASLKRATEQGRFTTRWQTDHWYNPGFFQGEAGIGYTLLRLLNPALPCVLLWK